jgi:hypothetical protein
VQLPAGSYEATWINTKDGRTSKHLRFKHAGGNKTLESPAYAEDVALRIRATK